MSDAKRFRDACDREMGAEHGRQDARAAMAGGRVRGMTLSGGAYVTAYTTAAHREDWRPEHLPRQWCLDCRAIQCEQRRAEGAGRWAS